MEYKVVFTEESREDIDSIMSYMIFELQNRQAADYFYDALKGTVEILKTSAGAFQLCLNSKLKDMGYRRLNLAKSKYFLLYRIEHSVVFVEGVFHQLQDFENII